MSKEINKSEDYRDSNKPTLKINDVVVGGFEEQPGMMYSDVRIDEHYKSGCRGAQLEDYLKNGWEPVYSTENILTDLDSDRSSEKDSENKPRLMTRNGRGGTKFIKLQKTREEFLKSEKVRVQKDQERFVASSTGRKVEQKGNSIKITDSEANEHSKLNNND